MTKLNTNLTTLVILTTLSNITSMEIKNKNETEYVVLIISAIGNNVRRMSIRSTWRNLVQNVYKEDGDVKYKWNIKEKTGTCKPNPFINIYFVIGTKRLSKEKLARLEIEQKQHNDFLLLDKVQDNYDNLSLKVLHAMKWCSKNFPKLRYVIKTDDDSFVRIDKIVYELDLYAPEMSAEDLKPLVSPSITDPNAIIKGFYWGTFLELKLVHSVGKYMESNWFLADNYLPYASGAGYVISKSIVDFLGRNLNLLHSYHSEDVSMGVYTASLDINRVHDVRFDMSKHCRFCQNNLLVMNLHVNTIKNMFMHYLILKSSRGEILCAKERFYNDTYLYDWTVVSSKCCNKKLLI